MKGSARSVSGWIGPALPCFTVSWREVDDDEWDGDLDGPLERRRLPPAVVIVAWIVVVAMLGSAVTAFLAVLFG